MPVFKMKNILVLALLAVVPAVALAADDDIFHPVQLHGTNVLVPEDQIDYGVPVAVIVNEANLGFAAACNQGLLQGDTGNGQFLSDAQDVAVRKVIGFCNVGGVAHLDTSTNFISLSLYAVI